MTTKTIKRHRFGITDRMACPDVVRWCNVLSVGANMAALEAEVRNPGFSAHEAYVLDAGELGLAVWRVELWAHDE